MMGFHICMTAAKYQYCAAKKRWEQQRKAGYVCSTADTLSSVVADVFNATSKQP